MWQCWQMSFLCNTEKIPITYCIIYCHQSNWPRIDCGNETITGNCHQLRKTHSPGKPSFPECSCLIVINTDLHSLNLSLNNNTLYKFHTYRIYCIYMSHYFCLFVNSLRMSEDNKALLTYLLTSTRVCSFVQMNYCRINYAINCGCCF